MKKPRKAPSRPRQTRKKADPMASDAVERVSLTADLPSLDGLSREEPTYDARDMASDAPALEIELTPDDLAAAEPVMTESGALETMLPDGGVEIDLNPQPNFPEEIPHDANLAEYMDIGDLGSIANEICDGVSADNTSRDQWVQDRAKSMQLLGMKMEEPRTNSDGQSENVSRVNHPLLAEAVLRFQANTRAELLPASGPVKVKNDGIETTETDDEADKLEDIFNHYLTKVASEYYPDTDRMFFQVGLTGMAFKKVYTCPLRKRPVSESIDPNDLIVADTATDLENAGRITHRIDMRRSTMRRMQLLGIYRDVDLLEPSPQPDAIKETTANIQGTQPVAARPEDQDYEIYEVYCELDLKGFEHRENGEVTGLPLPYRVTLDPHSKQILEIRRNWEEGDDDHRAKIPFVAYRYVNGLGFYGIGLGQLLANTTQAATAVWRLLIDAGMFANFPGGLVAKTSARQKDNNLRVKPGEFKEVNTGGVPIRNAVMELPYKEPSMALMQLIENIVQYGARVGNTAETQVGEGRQNAPVGTTLALLDAQTKVMSAVHKNMHQAQCREFELLLEEFKKDPACLWRKNKRAARYWDVPKIIGALENVALVPHADPNVPSAMHRMAKAQALYQLAAADPMTFNKLEVYRRILAEMDIHDADTLFAPPAPPQQPQLDPIKMAELKIKEGQLMLQAAKQQQEAMAKEKELQLKRDIATIDLAKTLAVHPASDPIVDEQLQQMAPLMTTPVRPSRPARAPRVVARRPQPPAAPSFGI